MEELISDEQNIRMLKITLEVMIGQYYSLTLFFMTNIQTLQLLIKLRYRIL